MLIHSTFSGGPAGLTSRSGNKVNAGILPESGPVLPLKRISPSRYTALKECALREIWSAARQQALLPPSPTAKLGGAIHRLLEEAGRERFVTMQAVEKRWASLVDEIEEQMAQSWLERPLIPLRIMVPDYEVRKIRACRKAFEISQESSFVPHGTKARPGVGFEVWVQSLEGLIGGFIDQVQESSDGPVLRDYKSGYVLAKREADGEPNIKGEYEAQLRLYAALYQSAFKHWPARLEIIPLQGTSRVVELQSTECARLLDEAGALLKQINAQIRELTARSAEDKEFCLASPSPSICRYCLFRPGCRAYQKARDDTSEAPWPGDVWGMVIEVRKLGNGRTNIGLQVTKRPYTVAQIRGLNSDPGRHPALQVIRVGDQVALYNLRGSTAGSYSETSSTVIYKLSEE